MSIESQGYFFTIYFPGFVCFVLYLDKMSGERLQDHWSSGFDSFINAIKCNFKLCCDILPQFLVIMDWLFILYHLTVLIVYSVALVYDLLHIGDPEEEDFIYLFNYRGYGGKFKFLTFICHVSYQSIGEKQITVTFLNFRTAENIAVICQKIQTTRPNLRVFCQKDANGIANSEDPDQTAPPLGAV